MSNPIWHFGIALSAVAVVSAAGPSLVPRTTGDSPRDPHIAWGGRPDTLVAQPRASSVRWQGGGLAGTVALERGLLVIRHEQLMSGSFTLDMTSLAVTATPAGSTRTRRAVRAGLTGAGAFDVDRHPTARFVSSGAERIGPTRWRIDGELTMHGVTRPLAFETEVRWAELGHMVATTSFKLDVREWGVASIDRALRVDVTLDARRKVNAVAQAARD